MPINYRDRNDPSIDRVRDLTRTRNNEPSKTEQSHTLACNLNEIMRQYGVTKTLPIMAYPPEMFGDDNLDLTLTDAYETVRDADFYFQNLPATLRQKFNNSPTQLWQWVNDPANADEAVSLGLLNRDPTTASPSGEAPKSTDST